VNLSFSSSEHWAPNLMILRDSDVPILEEMVSPTFLFNSSSLSVSLLPTTLDENELSRGFKPFVNFSSSTDMISLGLNGSFCIIEQILSSLGKTYHHSTLSGICGQYRD
jgi:hypothetical protein